MRVFHFVALCSALVLGCATARNELSGPDALRINATKLELDTVADDTVDAREGDATDWRVLELDRTGLLDIELHWDNDKANLSLELFDEIGKRLASGEVVGGKGRTIQFPVKAKGQYYVRVEAARDNDASPYSVKALFKRVRPKQCHDCTVDQQVCIAKDAYAVCAKNEGGCNAWTEILSCAPDQTCKNGACAVGCEDQCKPDARRCSSKGEFQVCVRNEGGCLQWDVPRDCKRGQVCSNGTCRKTGRSPPPPPKATEPTFVKGKIISMYMRDGRRTLHIEIGENTGVKKGDRGEVLEGTSNDAVANGSFRVVKVSGRFCIAQTALEAIGNNRTVRIHVK
jgi:hypothetical protein